jgi:LmbE family N-acetylglucosaminyl deacetylase
MKSVRSKSTLSIAVAILVVFACLVLFVVNYKQKSFNLSNQSSVAIVLSPHYDDAALSLGGYIISSNIPVTVATFFTASPEIATTTSWDIHSGFTSSIDASKSRTTENKRALNSLGVAQVINYFYEDAQYRLKSSNEDLESEISRDIQALIASYNGRDISVYGPAIFNSKINHPDHVLLHKAFIDVARDFPQKNVSFYFYEDYPYVKKFNEASIVSLEKNLKKDTGFIFDKINYYLSDSDVDYKMSSIKLYPSQIKASNYFGIDIVAEDRVYTSTRCTRACEVVYKIFRAP